MLMLFGIVDGLKASSAYYISPPIIPHNPRQQRTHASLRISYIRPATKLNQHDPTQVPHLCPFLTFATITNPVLEQSNDLAKVIGHNHASRS